MDMEVEFEEVVKIQMVKMEFDTNGILGGCKDKNGTAPDPGEINFELHKEQRVVLYSVGNLWWGKATTVIV